MTPVPDAGAPEPTPDPALARECRVFTRYLVGLDPSEYVVAKYASAHEMLPSLRVSGRFDELLLRLARGPALVRWPAAAFARVHAPKSALQNRLVTLLAILETAPESARRIDSAPAANAAWLVLLLAVRGSLAALSLMVGTVLLLPLRWALPDRSAGRTAGS